MTRALAALVLLLATVAGSTAQEEDPRFTRARIRATEGRGYISIRLCDHMLAEDPDQPEVLRLRADVYRQRGHLDEASLDYERLTHMLPDDLGAWFWLGTVERWSGRFEAALPAYGRAIELSACHLGALKGRARVHIAQGNLTAAEADLRAALECAPADPEASELLAELLARRGEGAEAVALLGAAFTGAALDRRVGDVRRVAGQEWAAAEAYARAVGSDPGDAHSRYWIEQLGPERSVDLLGRYNRADVIEGLELAGLWVPVPTGSDPPDTNYVQFFPAEVRYITNDTGFDLAWELTEKIELGAEASFGREAVENPTPVYDFNVGRALAGLDHRLTRSFTLDWRLGAVRYTSRGDAPVPSVSTEDPIFLVDIDFQWNGVDSWMSTTYDRTAFIGRSFAGSSTFRIFTRNRLAASGRRDMSHDLRIDGELSASHFSDGNDVFFAAAGLGWLRPKVSAWLRYRHDPFPARFLTLEADLDFIDYDAVTLSGRGDLGSGVKLDGELLFGYYGETRRTFQDGDSLKVGGLDNNTQWRLQVDLSWAPPKARVLRIGTNYFDDNYEFIAGEFNSNSMDRLDLYAELFGNLESVEGRLRYTRGWISDDRDPSYTSNGVLGRIDWDVGRIRDGAQPVEIGAEVLYWEDSIDEEVAHVWLDVTVPF